MLGWSLVQNGIDCPVMVFVVAVAFPGFFVPWLLGPDCRFVGYLFGLILVGIARCIEIVIAWNQLTDSEYPAKLIIINNTFR